MGKHEHKGIQSSLWQGNLIFLHILITEYLYHVIWYMTIFLSLFNRKSLAKKEKPEMHFWKYLINVDSYLIS